MNAQLRTSLPKFLPTVGRLHLHRPNVIPVRAYGAQRQHPSKNLSQTAVSPVKANDPESAQQKIMQDYERPDDIVGGKFWSGDVGEKEGLRESSAEAADLVDDELERGAQNKATEGSKNKRAEK